jgi:hypothetical protein
MIKLIDYFVYSGILQIILIYIYVIYNYQLY